MFVDVLCSFEPSLVRTIAREQGCAKALNLRQSLRSNCLLIACEKGPSHAPSSVNQFVPDMLPFDGLVPGVPV